MEMNCFINCVYAGSAPNNGDQYGFPYSCKNGTHVDWIRIQTTSNGGTWGISPCEALYFNDSASGTKISVATTTATFNYAEENKKYSTIENWGDNYTESLYLRHLFIKTSDVDMDNTSTTVSQHDYSGLTTRDPNVSSDDILNQCSNNTRTPETDFCAVYPTVSNIKLLNNLNIAVPVSSDGKFSVSKGGFYLVSFNTNVDAEQVPISKLTIRIKGEEDSFTDNTGIKTLTNIDPQADTNNSHKIGAFLADGTYQIMVKVEDNWSKYGCASSPSRDFSSATSNCGQCCNNTDTENKSDPFVDYNKNDDYNNCDQCF